MTIVRPCIVCGQPAVPRSSRCARHPGRRRGYDPRTITEQGLGGDHRRIAAQVLAEERTCWLCGGGGTALDPLTADHVIPRSLGGQNVRSNYRAAHRSCNSRRGAQLARARRRTQGGRVAT